MGGSQTYRLNFYFGISITLAGFFRPMGRREYRRELDLGVGGSVGGSQTSVLNFYFGISTTLAYFQTYGWAGV